MSGENLSIAESEKLFYYLVAEFGYSLNKESFSAKFLHNMIFKD